MSNLGIYLGHAKNLVTSSAGVVTHVTGVKVNSNSFSLAAIQHEKNTGSLYSLKYL
ncbi:hypothetical protein [Richelia intracellularis]|uniref:hypothetical protein n=1 Tax=Richelia intracellularis TaxID=1164990 RepID=UPI0012DDDFCB|nr:hypothetical protein [Richelia intracellularis]